MSEFLPEEAAAAEALPALGILAGLFFAWGCVHFLDAFCRGMFGTIEGAVGWIPYAGRVLRAPVHKIEQKVSHALGRAERGIDRRMGTAFHRLAHIVRHMVTEIEEQAKLLLGITLLLDSFLSFKHFRKLLRLAFAPLWKAIKHDAHIIARTLHLEHATRTTITRKVIPRVKGAEAVGAAAIGIALPRARLRERNQDLALARLWRWARRHSNRLSATAALGIVAWALSRLHLGALRCSTNRRILKSLCGPKGNYLEELLTAGVLIFGTVSIVELAKEIQDEMGVAVDGITGLIREKTG